MVEMHHEIPDADSSHNRRRNSKRKPTSRRTDWFDSDGTLYDRAQQQQALRDAYYRSKQQAEIALITGASGTGKTALANTLLPLIENDGGLFLRGKFDQHQYVTGQSPCLRAFQLFAKRVLARGKEEAQSVKRAIEEAVGSEIHLLLEVIPELGELLTPVEWLVEQEKAANSSGMDSSQSSSHNIEISESQTRVVSVFRRFLRSCSSRERPIVLFMDDLQWADDFALEVLARRLYETTEESRNPGLLFLATCRGNEVSVEDRLAVVLRSIEDKGTPITDIRVDNLSFDAQADMISNFLHLPRAECLPLVEVVYNQTQGNAFFSIQFLRSLEEERVLFRDNSKGGRWAWKAEALMVSLEATGNDDLIVQLLANKIKELPPDVLEVVKVASCLGNDFTEEILSHSVAVAQDQVMDALDSAEEEGVVVYDFDAASGCFSHDKFKEAAYSLIPDEQKASFHLRIARNLRQQLTLSASKKWISIILNQISAGIEELKDPTEREECAWLCLKAARKAGKAASFVTGSQYAELGMRLLERRHWRDQYDITLNLFNSAAELSYCSGKHERVHDLAREVVENARSSDDKLQVHIAKILTLQAETNSSAAIVYCIEVLRRLGQPFPKKPQITRIMYEYVQTKRKLANMSDDDIMRLPPLTDQKTMTAMVFIHQLFPLVQQNRVEYTPHIAFRLVHLTLKHGLSSISSCAFSILGAVLARKGDLDEAYRYVQLSFRILERYPSDHWLARCMLVAAGTVLSLTQPLRDVLPIILRGHKLGLKSGELEAGLICGVFHSVIQIIVGDPLPTVAKGNLQLIQLCHDYNQGIAGKMAGFVYHLNMHLQGKPNEVVTFNGEKLDREWHLKEALRENRTMLLIADKYFIYVVAFMTDDYHKAAALSREHKRDYHSQITPLPIFRPMQILFEGLVHTSLFWEKKGSLSQARRNHKILTSMVMVCPENVVQKAYLLEAEILACEGRDDQAVHKYIQAIKYAEKAGFISEQALANEKAGRMLLRTKRSAQALPFIKEARELYAKWGCMVKLTKMDQIIAELQVKGHGEK